MAIEKMKDDLSEIQRYRKSCETGFWQEVFRAESDYLLRHLKGARSVLSVGCGPAIIEGALGSHGFRVTGLDVTPEALGGAPDQVRTVVGSVGDMPFASATFDAVIFVASLQFIEHWRKAVTQAWRVLRDGGRLIVLLLNPASEFFRAKLRDPHSYVRKIRHPDVKEIEDAISMQFDVQTEYFLGVNGSKLFETHEPANAVLFVIRGKRKANAT